VLEKRNENEVLPMHGKKFTIAGFPPGSIPFPVIG
jgi:hypothetical protein